MHRYPLAAWAVWLILAGCAHAAGDGRETPKADERGSLLEKFDPALRWMLESKSGDPIKAVALLEAPLPETELERLQTQGVTVLSRSPRTLHVSGDPQALLYLAAYKQVLRLSASKPMRPSGDKERR